MALEKNFLRKNPSFLDIPRRRLVFGIVFGILFSVVFYHFSLYLKEFHRLFSRTEHNDLWALTPDENQFYNLFYAFLAAILGQSFVITFCLARPKFFFGKYNHRKKMILNEQRFLNWTFLQWFMKIAFLYFIVFGLSFRRGFYTFSFYPDYRLFFVLIIIVLFLQTWNTLRLAIRKNSFLWMLFSAIIVSLFAIGLTKINFKDFQQIDKTILDQNIYLKYNLNLPESDHYTTYHIRSLSHHIYMAAGDSNHSWVILNYEKVDTSDFEQKVPK